jgi:hydrogenase-4 component B
MYLFLAGILVHIVGAGWSLLVRNRTSQRVGPIASVCAASLVAAASILVLLGDKLDLLLPWPIPLGAIHLGLDPLSAIFALLVAVVSGFAAIYGRGYLRGSAEGRKLSYTWSLYNLFIASMFAVLAARNGFVFLFAWELMSLTSFFLVVYDHQKEEVGRAGWIYFITSHIGVAFLLVMFLLLDPSGSMEFDQFAAVGRSASTIFILGLIGFGVKAGLVPLHVWLPEAHPAAPSHVSAVMSGVMIKLGIYGLLRMLMFLGAPNPWWGWTLVIIGAASGILGVLFALAQHDLKRLLAYHSVENIGIIVLGLGLGVLGICSGNALMATMGFCGGILHVLNHAIFKSLLFMGAGAVQRATGTLQLDQLGGLLKRMPVTGVTFLIGSVAISALPPFNGFVSEFFIYFSSLSSVFSVGQPWAGVLVLASLAIIGGLAAACFSKAFGIVFLGAPRSESAASGHEQAYSMRLSMMALAGLCVLMGLGAIWMLKLVRPVAEQFLPSHMHQVSLATPLTALLRVTIVALVLIVTGLLIMVMRKLLLSKRSVREEETWGCGYLAPTPRMQYTSSSFAEPVINMFRGILSPKVVMKLKGGFFPTEASLHSHAGDPFMSRLFRPAFEAIEWIAGNVRRVRTGQMHHYVLYIALTILALLFWRLG